MKTLKYIKIFVTSFLLLFTLNSCEDYLLDNSVPLDEPGGDNFYNTPLKVRSGIVGVLEVMYTLYDQPPSNQALLNVYENRSDNGWRLPDPAAIDHHDQFTTLVNNAPTKMWNDNYQMISRANIMIEAIENRFPDFENDPEMARYMGEARFLRAMGYFHLVTIFGGVPLIEEQLRTVEAAQNASRALESEVYAQIIEDLEFASNNCFTRSALEASGQIGHVTQGAAKVLLAEAYLFEGQFADAERVAEEVIASGEYEIVPNYDDMFGEGSDNHAGSIFEIQYDWEVSGRASQYSRLLPFIFQSPVTNFTFTTSVSVPSNDLVYDMVDANDTRFGVTLDTGLVSLADGIYVRGNYWNKYMDFSITTQVNDDWNVTLFRLADAYHMAAEAEIQQNKVAEAFDHINPIRQRAGMPAFESTGVSQAEALDLYLEERRFEFAGEMKRWRDLKRTGKAIEIMEEYLGRSIPETQLIYPIPISEIQANPDGLPQNPGY